MPHGRQNGDDDEGETMRRMFGVVVLGLLAALTMALGAPDAGADCMGPTLRVNPAGGPGGSTVTVTGDYFGTNCYDTGPPPLGQGYLGLPQTGIAITFTDAAGAPTTLATVDAGPQYHFQVEVQIPADAATGAGTFQAGGSLDVPFEVSGGVIPATPAYTG
jgi:hypothetical protein